MKGLVAGIRVLAVLLGILWVAGTMADLLGVLPHSDTTPPLGQRILHAIPLLLVCALLLAPYRFARSGVARWVVGAGLVFVVGWVAFVSIGGVRGYLAGRKSWHVVPSGVVLIALAGSNLWAFQRITREG